MFEVTREMDSWKLIYPPGYVVLNVNTAPTCYANGYSHILQIGKWKQRNISDLPKSIAGFNNGSIA